MISIEDIKRIAATKKVPESIVEKDYILDWFLWGISNSAEFVRKLIFKGGTALHKMYFTDWRFSEDLDFTSTTQITEKDLAVILPKLCKKIYSASGIEMKCREIIPEGKVGQEWCIKSKIEYIGPRKQTGGNLPIIVLDIMNDELVIQNPLNKRLLRPHRDVKLPIYLKTYSLEEITAEKMRSVLYQRCWSRDVYDLWRLLKEYGSLFSLQSLMKTYMRKCTYKGYQTDLPDKFMERILRLERQWSSGLQRQISNIPSFEQVQTEIKMFLSELFDEIKNQGGVIMIDIQYSMRYKKGDLEIEVQGDKDFVEQKFKELLAVGAKIRRQAESLSDRKKEDVRGRKPSIIEFLRSKGDKFSHTDRIVLFGYYLETFEEYESFNVKNIEQCYRKARIPLPKNFPAYIKMLIKNVYIMEASEKKDSRKSYQLTDTGIKYVEETFGSSTEG
jgi:predicted nucleotidyltransferase component of viral defense system